MADYDFNENVNSNEGGTFDLNSFSTVNKKSDTPPVKLPEDKEEAKKDKKAKIIKTVLTVTLIGVITFCLIVGAFAVYVFGFIDDSIPYDLRNLSLDFTTTIYVEDQSSGEYVEYKRIHGAENRIWVDYELMPVHLRDAFIAIEDERFDEHDGVDWKRTVGAFANEFLKFSSKFGGSTITQQLVKNLTMDNDQNAMRKVREIMRARRMEMDYDKDLILEGYLNTVCLGGGKYGVEVGANYYFGKTTSELTIAESAMLASIVKSPEYYRPDVYPENNRDRMMLVLGKMLEIGRITEEEYDAAVAEEVVLVNESRVSSNKEVYSYFIDAVIDQVSRDLSEKYDIDVTKASEMVYSGGYKIYTTMIPSVQEAVDNVFSDESYRLKNSATGELGQASITVMDYQGRVVGISGGLGEKTQNRALNRATSSPRQPGSTMKPLGAYAPAVEDGIITYSTLLNDREIYYNKNTWTPKNWYGGYLGNITAAYALERSNNTMPVMLVNTITPQKSYDFVTQKLGITTLNYPDDANLSPLGLGGTNGGLTTLESAAAYATFGNGGKYYEPIFYTKVTDQHDEIVLQNKSKAKVAMGEDTATIMNKMLQNVVYGGSGTGRGAASYIPNMPIYAKTGTSQETNDLWFVGGSPYYVASCWYGYDSNGVISNSGIARTLWGKVMSQVHKGLEAKDFPMSKYAVMRYYCTETGQLATNACESTAIGYYKKTDRETCSVHKGSIRDILTEIPKEPEETTSSETASSEASAETPPAEAPAETPAE